MNTVIIGIEVGLLYKSDNMLCIELTHCFKIDICPKLAYLDHCRLFAIKIFTPHAMVFKITLLEVEGKINSK